jgi:hypothetical protein
LIVGIDPGTTVGIAVLDAQGKIISLTSKREAKRGEIIKYVTQFGRPVLIASDVSPMPKTIQRLASSLGCGTYSPITSLTNIEKEKMLKEFQEEIRNSHQKDALAAALKAYRNYHGLFTKIDQRLIKQEKKDIFTDVAKILIKEKTKNITDTIRRVVRKK